MPWRYLNHGLLMARRLLPLVLLAVCLSGTVALAITTRIAVGTRQLVLTLTNVASGSASAVGTPFDPINDTESEGYLLCDVIGDLTFSGTPLAAGGIPVWLFESWDGGTTYEDNHHRMPNAVLKPNSTSGSTVTRTIVSNIQCPKRIFRAQMINDGTGVAVSGTIFVQFSTPEGL